MSYLVFTSDALAIIVLMIILYPLIPESIPMDYFSFEWYIFDTFNHLSSWSYYSNTRTSVAFKKIIPSLGSQFISWSC